MASIKNLKKNVNYVLSDIIEECYVAQIINDDKKGVKAEKIIDEAIAIFDTLIVKINTKNIKDKKKHFKAINKELETKAQGLLNKLNKL